MTGQKFLGLKSIVLKNLWQDGSMMHERLAMAFFARMGQPASRQSFCRLYINNELQGLYVIVESVDNSYLDRTLGEHAGYLYSYQFQGHVPRRVPRRGVRAIQGAVPAAEPREGGRLEAVSADPRLAA